MSTKELKRLNKPMDEKEVKAYLERLPTLEAFLRTNSCYIVNREEDHREQTHAGMDGHVYHISMRTYPAFIAFLIRNLNMVNPVTYYMCELLTPEFRMFADFDIESAEELKKEDWEKLGATVQASMLKYYKKGTRAAWYMTYPETKRTVHNEEVYRYGLHIVWWEVITNRHYALAVHALLLADIKRNLPAPEPPSNSWDSRFDKSVYGIGKATGSLRMPGCEKMKSCKTCKPLRKRKTKTTTSTSSSLTTSGDVGIVSSASAPAVPDYSECSFCGGTGRISIGRPYHPEWIFGEDGKIDEAETKKFQNNWDMGLRLGALRVLPGTPLTENLDIPENAPRPYDPSFYEAARFDSEGKPLLPLLDKNGNVIKEPRRITSKKDTHLKEFLSCPLHFDSYKKYTTGYKYRVNTPTLMTYIQAAIREYNESYKDIMLIDIRANKLNPPRAYRCTVEGFGMNHCLNKGAPHTSFFIYFEISPDGYLYQKCTSPKPVERPCGHVYCSVYSSTRRPLPDLVRQCLNRKNKSSEFDSVEEEIHYEKFKTKSMEARYVPEITSSELEKALVSAKEQRELKEIRQPVENCPFMTATSSLETIDVERDTRDLTILMATLKKQPFKKKPLDLAYLDNLRKLQYKFMDSLGLFDKSEKRVDETDIRHIKLTAVGGIKAQKDHKLLETKESKEEKKPRRKRKTA